MPDQLNVVAEETEGGKRVIVTFTPVAFAPDEFEENPYQ